jgi:hypothetical protein
MLSTLTAQNKSFIILFAFISCRVVSVLSLTTLPRLRKINFNYYLRADIFYLANGDKSPRIRMAHGLFLNHVPYYVASGITSKLNFVHTSKST